MNKTIWKMFFLTIFMYENLLSTIKIGRSPNDVLNFVKNYLPDNPTILEAGGYDGEDTFLMSWFWPNGIVHSFEPVPENFNKLKAKTELRKNVHSYPIALSDKSGTELFYVSAFASNPDIPSASGSLLAPSSHLEREKHVIFNRTIEVNTVTVDEWAARNNISHIDFMWLDMQGHELNMLKYAQNILKNVRIIYTEVEFAEAYKNQPLYTDVKNWLEAHGFKLLAVDFDENHAALANAIPINEMYFGNAVFINTAFEIKEKS